MFEIVHDHLANCIFAVVYNAFLQYEIMEKNLLKRCSQCSNAPTPIADQSKWCFTALCMHYILELLFTILLRQGQSGVNQSVQ